jgi:hypothetical protein
MIEYRFEVVFLDDVLRSNPLCAQLPEADPAANRLRITAGSLCRFRHCKHVA